MGLFLNAYARTLQGILWLAAFCFSFKEPKLYSGAGSISKIPEILKRKNKKNPLIVTDEGIYKIGLQNSLINTLEKENINYAFYHDVVVNPTTNNVEVGLRLYQKCNCDCLIALGGGSAMDCAKAIGARVVKSKKQVNQMRGLLRIRKRLPFMIAIPTTAGTGSETTAAAVIVDKEKNDKYAIDDPVLIPKVAILDPTYLVGLPKHISSTTGMDALTHAVEAYIGHSNTHKSKKYAVDAIKLVFEYLEKSVENPTNLEYREKMQIASYKAGVAFTRAYVGSVHAIAHALGGKYNVPHGLANAIILPIVLKAYGDKVNKKLTKLATYIGINSSNKNDLALLFIREIENLNEKMGVSNTFGSLIKDEDISFLVDHSYNEAVPLYPTPKILFKVELAVIFKILQESR